MYTHSHSPQPHANTWPAKTAVSPRSSSLRTFREESAENVPSGEERRETAVFRRLTNTAILTSLALPSSRHLS